MSWLINGAILTYIVVTLGLLLRWQVREKTGRKKPN
jgi:hypothetical protein